MSGFLFSKNKKKIVCRAGNKRVVEIIVKMRGEIDSSDREGRYGGASPCTGGKTSLIESGRAQILSYSVEKPAISLAEDAYHSLRSVGNPVAFFADGGGGAEESFLEILLARNSRYSFLKLVFIL